MNDNKNLNNHEEYTPKKEDFVLVQNNDKIYDVKMETKATTFARDAFKRFCKNKSSVVGAFIIGFIMLLALIVPIVSPYNIDVPDPNQALLTPKLFEAGTGFWDGTKVYKDVVYNTVTESAEGFNPNAIVSKKVHGGKIININNADQTTYIGTTMGGYYRFMAEPGDYSQAKRIENKFQFDVKAGGDYFLNIELGNEASVNDETISSVQGKYRIVLVSGKNEIAVLQDWTTEHKNYSFNLSDILGDRNVKNVGVKIQLQRQPNKYSHVLVKKIEFGANNVNEEEKKYLEDISLIDPCKTFFLKKNDLNQFPIGYYSNSGLKSVYKAEISLVDIVYDVYAAQLGLMNNFEFGKSDMDKYIENTWCTYDYSVGPSSFVKLSDKCPIEKVTEQSEGTGEFEGIINLKGDVILYKYKGFDKMPLYLLGTTAQGYDLIKLSFVALRTSLLIAIVTSAICLAIGLCWGSISGYFGGNVDLTMERITDILANIPFIVVMTLIILVLGNNIFTFALALCLTSWIGVAARTRTQFYRFKGREYILASRTLGASDGRLIFKHILPNALGTIVTSSVLMIPSVIFSEASISYLGLGLQGQKSFGVILSQNQQYLSSFPSLIVFPAIIISLLMISFNLFGNGLRDALNPSLKGSE